MWWHFDWTVIYILPYRELTLDNFLGCQVILSNIIDFFLYLFTSIFIGLENILKFSSINDAAAGEMAQQV